MALCHGRGLAHEPRQPRMSHRLKTSKGKRAKRGRGGGEATEKIGGFSETFVAVSQSMGPLRATAITGLSRDRVIDVQRGRESSPIMVDEKLLTLGVREGPDFGLKKQLQDGIRHVRQPDIRF